MSFVTVFTAGTMAFVLLVPLLMLLVLSTLSPLRRAVVEGLDALVDGAEDLDVEPAAAVNRAA